MVCARYISWDSVSDDKGLTNVIGNVELVGFSPLHKRLKNRLVGRGCPDGFVIKENDLETTHRKSVGDAGRIRRMGISVGLSIIFARCIQGDHVVFRLHLS